MVVLTSKFNYLDRSNNSDLLVLQAPLFESDEIEMQEKIKLK
jgi:hypothetical protein